MITNPEEIAVRKQQLEGLEADVCLQSGTETPFTGSLLSEKRNGKFICKVCEQPLFSSETKYDSGSGWPSFYDVVGSDAVEIRTDNSLGMTRKEVVCSNCGIHLGHVFSDGPIEKTGVRYCINSAALNFRSADELQA